MLNPQTTRRHAHWLIPAAALLALLAPFLFTDRAFWVDASNQLWLVHEQRRGFGSPGWPSYFVSTDRTGLFYPIFAFYGGTAYAAFGGLAALTGGRTMAVDVVSWAFPLIMAYGGFTWIAHQVGLRGWRVHAPGLVFVTSAYYLTNVYGRGDWGETMATSAIPLLVASFWYLAKASRWRAAPVALLAVACIVFTGSHNITLLWGCVFLLAVAVVAGWAFPEARQLRLRRIAELAGLGVLAIGVNAWFLLPNLAFGHRTRIAGWPAFSDSVSKFFERPGIVFNPFRSVPPESTTPNLYVQLPVLVIAWLVAAQFVVSGHATSRGRRAAGGVAAVGVAFLAFVLFNEPWHHVPAVFRYTQYAYRLTTYVDLAIAGLVIVVLKQLLAEHTHPRQSAEAALAVVLGVGLLAANWQVWSSRSFLPTRSSALSANGVAPGSWYDIASYNDVKAPVVPTEPGRAVRFDTAKERAGRFSEVVNPPSGNGPIVTNIAAATNLVHVEGLVPIGRTGDSFWMVVRRPPDRLAGPLSVTVTTASNGVIRTGRWVSLFTLAGLGLLLLYLTARTASRVPRSAEAAGQ